MLKAEAAIEAEVADEPDGEVLASIEVEGGEAVEFVQDVVADEDGELPPHATTTVRAARGDAGGPSLVMVGGFGPSQAHNRRRGSRCSAPYISSFVCEAPRIRSLARRSGTPS